MPRTAIEKLAVLPGPPAGFQGSRFATRGKEKGLRRGEERRGKKGEKEGGARENGSLRHWAWRIDAPDLIAVYDC